MFNGFNISTISECYFGSTPATAIYYGSTEVWSAVRDYSKEYLTFESLEDNNVIGWKMNDSSASVIEIYYSTDGTTWNSVTSTTEGETMVTLNTGDKLYLKGNNNAYGKGTDGSLTGEHYNYFTSTKTFNIYGNLASLHNSTDFRTRTRMENYLFTFTGLFSGCKVVDAGNLVWTFTNYRSHCYSFMFRGCTSLTTPPALPNTSLSNYCYAGMFEGCTSLTTPPALPGTTIPTGCYKNMFKGCSSLLVAPEIYGTDLGDDCYTSMFENCTALTTAPLLAVATLSAKCYNSMFKGCTHLNYIKCLATDISASNCTSNWVNNVAASGTFVKATYMDSWTLGASGIPNGWVVRDDEALDINYFTIESRENSNVIKFYSKNQSVSARTIQYSFDKVSWSYVTASDTGTTITTLNNGQKVYIRGYNPNGVNYWASGVGHNPCYFGTSKKFNVYGYVMSLIRCNNTSNYDPNGDNKCALYGMLKGSLVVDASGLIFPTNFTPSSCYSEMFMNCTQLTAAPALPGTTVSNYSYSNMFNGCTSLVTAPDLPAATLAQYSYNYMFAGCTKLSTIKLYATNVSANNCLRNWVGSVKSSGHFYKKSSLTLSTGTSGIPSGWTVHNTL